MGLRSRTLACAATRARQTQTTTACPQHSSGLYRSHARVVGDPEVMRRNLSLRIIANSLTEQCGHKTFQISGFWADYGQTAPYCLLLRPESPYGHGALDLAIETASIQGARLGCTGRQDFIVSVAG